MKEWGAWDWIAFSALWVAAVILALDAGLKSTESLRKSAEWLLGFKPWPFLPLIFVLFGSLVFVARSFGYLTPSIPISSFSKWPDNYKASDIIGKTFRNERVILDGFSYVKCNFYNVTFVYNGTTPVKFSNNNVFGSINIASDNPAVSGTLTLAYGFSILKDNVNIDIPPNSVLERGTIGKRPK